MKITPHPTVVRAQVVVSASVARPAFFVPNIDGESAQTVAAFARPCADRSYQLFGQEMST